MESPAQGGGFHCLFLFVCHRLLEVDEASRDTDVMFSSVSNKPLEATSKEADREMVPILQVGS